MSRKRLSFSLAAMLMGGTALADVPDVAVDIAPVHSLVAQVMAGVGTPDLILPPGATPHEYNLRPSEAAALQQADIVVWMGNDLAPWMSDAVATLAEQATVLTLLEAEETSLLDVRQNAVFEHHDHDHDDHDDHGHEETSEASHSHDHAEKEHAEGHDDDGHGHDDHDAGHNHGASDAHAWLSPSNAAAWLRLIAADLSAADPENAKTYKANAAQARAALGDLNAEVNAILESVRGGSFIVFHDAYQYFENDFDFPASGAISVSDAADPSPARIAEIQDRVRDQGIDCVLAEPQFNKGLVTTVLDGTDARYGVIDPIGIDLDPGPALYAQLIRNMAKTLAGCL